MHVIPLHHLAQRPPKHIGGGRGGISTFKKLNGFWSVCDQKEGRGREIWGAGGQLNERVNPVRDNCEKGQVHVRDCFFKKMIENQKANIIMS